MKDLLHPRRALLAAAFAVLAATAAPGHRAAAQTTVDGGQTINISSDTTYSSGLIVGNTSTGTVNQTGGTVTASSQFTLGNNTGAVGYYNMLGGTLNANASGEQLNVGSNGTGTFVQTGTSTVNAYTLNLQTGTNSSYSMATGGTLNVSNLFSVKVGNTYAQTGGTTTIGIGTTAGTFRVYGGSTMNLSGGTFTATSTTIGIGSGNLLGYFAGANATGTLNLSGTGSIAFTGTAFNVGLGATGVINQSGTSTLTAARGIILGTNYTSGSTSYTGSGTANLDGGMLSTTAITLGAVATSGTTISTAPGTGVVNLNGGTLTALASTTNFLSVTTANVRNGGVPIDSGANAITVAQPLLHSNVSGDAATDGGLTKVGTGTLTLTGANTYTGGTTFAGGALNVGSAGALGSGGPLSFTGGTLQFSAGNTTDYSGRFSTAANQLYSLDTNGQNVALASALTSTGGSLTKLGGGTLTLSGANTYTGGTVVSAGTLTVANNSGLGTGSVTLAASTKLTLNAGVVVTNMTGATLTLADTATSNVNLLGTGVQDTVLSLVIGGVTEPAGTYGAVGNALATNPSADFTGTGLLVVTSGPGAVPEPSTWALLAAGAGLLGAGVLRRRA